MSTVVANDKRWWTYAEAAVLLGRHQDHIRKLIRAHNLKSRKVRQGRHPRRIRQISTATLETLRVLTRQ